MNGRASRGFAPERGPGLQRTPAGPPAPPARSRGENRGSPAIAWPRGGR